MTASHIQYQLPCPVRVNWGPVIPHRRRVSDRDIHSVCTRPGTDTLRPSELRPSELRPSELRPSELRPSEQAPAICQWVTCRDPLDLVVCKLARQSLGVVRSRQQMRLLRSSGPASSRGAGRRPGDHDWPGRYAASGETARVMNTVAHACSRHRQRPSDEPSACRVWEFQLNDTAPESRRTGVSNLAGVVR